MKRSTVTSGNLAKTSKASSDQGPVMLQVCVNAMVPTVSQLHDGFIAAAGGTSDALARRRRTKILAMAILSFKEKWEGGRGRGS